MVRGLLAEAQVEGSGSMSRRRPSTSSLYRARISGVCCSSSWTVTERASPCN